MLGEYVVAGVAHGTSCLSLVQNESPADNAVRNQDNEEVAENIHNHAIAGMFCVISNIASIHSVGKLI